MHLGWLAALLLVTSTALAQDAPKPLETPGKIDSVTVYRGQALVARTVNLPGPGGLREVVITGLPEKVVPGSLFAESVKGAEVRSVLYRERAVSQDVREEVRKLDDQIRAVQDNIAANQRSLQTLAEQRSYLDKLETFVAPTAQMELTKGVLNADTIKTLTAFQFDQRNTIAANELKLNKEARDLNEQMAVLQRQRGELTGGSARTVREAVIFANIPAAGGQIRLRYLVSDATWFPSYNVRGDRGAKQVTLEYNASIQQQSGEDWTDVQMTLSTATPSLVAMAPTLEPLSIALTAEPRRGAGEIDGQAGYKATHAALEMRKVSENAQRNRDNGWANNMTNLSSPTTQPSQAYEAAAQQAQVDLDRGVNDVARDIQVLELVAKDAGGRDHKSQAADETVSVTYQLANRTSLPSRQDTQLIQVASLPMPSEFYKLAAPVLSSYVYDQATLTNNGQMVLLAGPVASYLSGQFVGSGQIPTVAIGETFNVGFGIDSSLRATRELVEKTETTQGGNKVMNFNYHLTLENFGTTAATVRLTDRLPTTKDNEVKVTLVSSTKDVSNDAAYQEHDHKKGLLRWDIPVEPQAIAAKAVTLDYLFKLEFDKQMTIAGMPLTH